MPAEISLAKRLSFQSSIREISRIVSDILRPVVCEPCSEMREPKWFETGKTRVPVVVLVSAPSTTPPLNVTAMIVVWNQSKQVPSHTALYKKTQQIWQLSRIQRQLADTKVQLKLWDCSSLPLSTPRRSSPLCWPPWQAASGFLSTSTEFLPATKFRSLQQNLVGSVKHGSHECIPFMVPNEISPQTSKNKGVY